MTSKEDLIKIAYFTSIAGASILLGFSISAKKIRKDSAGAALYDEGVVLAKKALYRGTLYSLCGVSLLAVASYHLIGKKLIASQKIKSKNENSLPPSESEVVDSK